jgi:hypothetical protein
MIFGPSVAHAAPRTAEARLEILKAARAFMQGAPDQSQLRQSEIASIRHELQDIARIVDDLRRNPWSLLSSELRRYGYNPDEPRIPKHQPGGGRWTKDGTQFAAEGADDATSILQSRGGHHFVPVSVYNDLPLKPETRKVFDDARTGSLKGGGHGWSRQHDAYNQAVYQALEDFLERNGVQPEDMTPEQAQQFVFEVIGSGDARIRDLNLKLYRREILNYILRHIPFIGLPESRGGSGGEE